MLQTKMAPSSVALRAVRLGVRDDYRAVGSAPLVIPLPTRPMQLLTFSSQPLTASIALSLITVMPRVIVVGPQTASGWLVGLWTYRQLHLISSYLASTGCSASP